MAFDEDKKEFIFSEEQLRIDDNEDDPDNTRMAKRCLPAMNAVNKNLRFTTEAPEDFPMKRLPTLDFMLWMKRGLLYHTYFEKAMKNQVTIMQRSAMSEHQRMAILSNELVRRLSNIHRDVVEQEMETVIEHYISQLKNSGYNRKQARETVVCGVVGWRRKLERREKQGQKQYLEAQETLEQRTEDKLLEKTSWYKGDKKRKRENEESQFKYKAPPTGKRRKGIQGNQPKPKQERDKPGTVSKVKAVMFVPFTRHSELANRLRENEESMEKMSGYKLKIVERGGTKIVDMLHKANPWAGQDCERKKCLLCTTKKEEDRQNSQDCRKRNCVYETTCITCRRRQDLRIETKYAQEGKKKIDEEKRKARHYIYIGETNRSPYERGLEHQNDIAACKTSSHMLRHLLDQHEDEEEDWDNIKFGMRVLKTTRTAFER